MDLSGCARIGLQRRCGRLAEEAGEDLGHYAHHPDEL